MLEASVAKVISGEPSALVMLRRFNGVYLLDSSTVALPDELAEVWEGCGGSSPKNTSSSLKLHVRWDLIVIFPKLFDNSIFAPPPFN